VEEEKSAENFIFSDFFIPVSSQPQQPAMKATNFFKESNPQLARNVRRAAWALAASAFFYGQLRVRSFKNFATLRDESTSHAVHTPRSRYH
jgi:hypothetical protein